MTASHAFLARTRVPNTVPGPRKFQPAERLPDSIDLADLERLNAQRTYRVEFKRDLHPGSPLRWQMKPYGDGHWCRCDGQPHWFSSEAAAEAAGETWVRTGRMQP